MFRRRVASVITAVAVVTGLTISAVGGLWPSWIGSMAYVAAARTSPSTPVTGGALPSAPLLVPQPSAAPPINTPVITAETIGTTPPMGWNGFNHFYLRVTAATVEAEARALVSSGMKAAGYTYVNLDGGWGLHWRTARGALNPDPAKFPHGILPVADYVHSLGLKFGIYTSAGTQNCAGTSAGSFGHFPQDAATFASWGVDYLKLDWCSIPYASYPGMTHRQVGELLATQMRSAITATGRAIVYDVNDWTNDNPSSWARGLANLWRTAPDSQDRYASMVWNFTHTVSLYRQAGPGGWNDPDMLEIGNGGMTASEYESQFTLWAEMAAPLIAGNDLSQMTEATRSILTNQAVIAVDQDPLGRPGYPVASAGGHWVLMKPLADGDSAVVLFNQTDVTATITTTLPQVGVQRAGRYMLLDLWSGSSSETAGDISAVVPPHGVAFYLVETRLSRSIPTD
jgi:alpha-galactosidase